MSLLHPSFTRQAEVYAVTPTVADPARLARLVEAIAPAPESRVLDLSRRTCPKCGKEFLIENDVPKKCDGGFKKPSESVKPVRALKRTKSR
jgi:hypothetical protein